MYDDDEEEATHNSAPQFQKSPHTQEDFFRDEEQAHIHQNGDSSSSSVTYPQKNVDLVAVSSSVGGEKIQQLRAMRQQALQDMATAQHEWSALNTLGRRGPIQQGHGLRTATAKNICKNNKNKEQEDKPKGRGRDSGPCPEQEPKPKHKVMGSSVLTPTTPTGWMTNSPIIQDQEDPFCRYQKPQ